MRAKLLFFALLFGACGAPLSFKKIQPQIARSGLITAANDFYAATSTSALWDALQRAEQAGPDTAVYHELKARAAQLDGMPQLYVAHLIEALLDPENDAAPYHLELLARSQWSDDRTRIEALLSLLSKAHKSAEVSAKAQHMLADLLHHQGSFGRAVALREQRAGVLDFALIGPFDNAKGAGFDRAYPPEVSGELSLDERYDGAMIPVGWRRPKKATFGADWDLSGMFSPSEWVVAYAAAAFELKKSGRYALRIDSSAPIKVFLNGRVIFEVPQIDGSMFDQFVLPLELGSGQSRLLIKSAQTVGPWELSVRLTMPDGRAVQELRQIPLDQATIDVVQRRAPAVVDVNTQLDARVGLSKGPRQRFHRMDWSRLSGLGRLAFGESIRFLSRYRRSILGEASFARLGWVFGKKKDLQQVFQTLAKRDAVLDLVLLRARFLGETGGRSLAGELLTAKRDSKSPQLWWALAQWFEAQKWLEDRCQALNYALSLRPGWPAAMRSLGDCLKEQGYQERARGIYLQLLERLPGDLGVLSRLHRLALEGARLDEAERFAEMLVKVAPHLSWTWARLGETKRRAEDHVGAKEALLAAAAQNPGAASYREALGRLAYERQDTKAAKAHWEAALVRRSSDPKLAARLARLAPERAEVWEEDVPDAAALEKAVFQARSRVLGSNAVDVVDVLDHEVTVIREDGATLNYVTLVTRVLTEAGQKRMANVPLREGGEKRIIHAYSVGPGGRKISASVNRRTARFKEVKVGSVVVLQYRLSMGPESPLGVGRGWWFQAPSRYMARSIWVVWMPAEQAHHEWLSHPVKREETRRGEMLRLVWSAEGGTPFVAEPGIPAVSEIAMNMLFSTVPSWARFLEPEREALKLAFSTGKDEALVELAARLFKGAETPQEKLRRIQRYLVEEVRTRGGPGRTLDRMKIDPPWVVIPRAHADSKDKVALFVALAQRAGLVARYALLRSRFKGPVQKGVPMQQFDRAAVYVPVQAGVEQARFFDPMAEGLEVDVLPFDLPGTWALVLEPEQHIWVKVPYQAAEANRQTVRARMKIGRKGTLSGVLEVEAFGRYGTLIRNMVKEPKRLEQSIAGYASRMMKKPELGEYKVEQEDLDRPVRIAAKVRGRMVAKRMEKKVGMSLPKVWAASALFRRNKRQYPLVLGAPFALRWYTELELPEGAVVEALPEAGKVETPCFELSRKTSQKGRRVIVDQRFRTKCERILPEQYGAHREGMERMNTFYGAPLLMRLEGGGSKL